MFPSIINMNKNLIMKQEIFYVRYFNSPESYISVVNTGIIFTMLYNLYFENSRPVPKWNTKHCTSKNIT